MVNILQPIPNTWPSFWNSIAGAATELAKPVIGTIVPAPANWPILSKIPNPVKSDVIKTIVIDTKLLAVFSSILNNLLYISNNPSAIQLIKKKKKKALIELKTKKDTLYREYNNKNKDYLENKNRINIVKDNLENNREIFIEELQEKVRHFSNNMLYEDLIDEDESIINDIFECLLERW